MEREMEKEKNIFKMEKLNLMEIIYMGKEMEWELNIMTMEIYYMKENI